MAGKLNPKELAALAAAEAESNNEPEQEEDPQDEQDPNQEAQQDPQAGDGEDDQEDPGPDEDNEEAEEEEAAKEALAQAAMRGKKVSKATTPAAQDEVLYTQFDGDVFLTEVEDRLTPIVKAVVKEILEGLAPDIKTLRVRTQGLVKGLDAVKLQIEEVATQSNAIQKALGKVEDKEKLSKALAQEAAGAEAATQDTSVTTDSEPIEKAATPAPGDKPADPSTLTIEEKREVSELIDKAIEVRTDSGLPVPGLDRDIIFAQNTGKITRTQVENLKKGLAAVEAQLKG